MNHLNSLRNKLFTKQWWEDYWFYYKVHTMVVVIVSLILITSIVQCSLEIKPDLVVNYIGSIYWDEEEIAQIEREMQTQIADANDDGDVKVMFVPLYINIEDPDPSMLQKIMVELAEGEARLFLLDKSIYDAYNQEELFIDISDFMLTDAPQNYSPTSNFMFVRERGLEELFRDIYACVKFLRPNQQDKLSGQQQNALNIIKYLNNMNQNNMN